MSDTIAGQIVFDDLEIGEIAIELDDQEPQDVIEWALDTLGDGVVVVTALQADGMAILDMAYRLKPELKVLTVDTLRLPQATYDYIDVVRRHYPQADFEVLRPDEGQVVELEPARRCGRLLPVRPVAPDVLPGAQGPAAGDGAQGVRRLDHRVFGVTSGHRGLRSARSSSTTTTTGS